jgi:polyisoprenoid-binding protein YceI
MKRFAICIAMLAACCTSAQGAEWRMDPAGSSLAFDSSYDGEAFVGRFARFEPSITLDPAKPDATSILVSIDLASVDTGNSERDGTLATPDFFWTANFPQANFATTHCVAGAAAGAIDCDAQLTIRDKTVTLPFRLQFAENADSATLKAVTSVDRLVFGVGGGDWADTDLIPAEVVIRVDLALRRKS